MKIEKDKLDTLLSQAFNGGLTGYAETKDCFIANLMQTPFAKANIFLSKHVDGAYIVPSLKTLLERTFDEGACWDELETKEEILNKLKKSLSYSTSKTDDPYYKIISTKY